MDLVGVIATWLLIGSVIVTAFNVANRYYLQIPGVGVGGEEVAWHCYAACFMLGIPYAIKTSAHVRVDIFFDNLPKEKQAYIDFVGSIIFLAPMCLIIMWGGYHFTQDAWELGNRPSEFIPLIQQIITDGVGEKSQDPGGLLNRWFIKSIIPVSFFLSLLACISLMLDRWQIITSQDSEQTNGGVSA
jgi:TRAP-type mannitol/chloroaromatic compound transport system permease small subunit